MTRNTALTDLSRHLEPRKGFKFFIPVNGLHEQVKLIFKKPAAGGLWLIWLTHEGSLYVSGPEGTVTPYRQWLRRQKEIEGLV